MLKRILLSLSVFIIAAAASFAQPKYVFYFIGDGMGVPQVLLAEEYLSAAKGELGIEKLAMSQLPYATFSSHYSADSDVTDSAASATALSSGIKTNNYYVGVDPEGNPVTTMAEMAKRCGKKVGILTTVTVNHATPAGFSAHQMHRQMLYEIARDEAATGFDFFAGAGIEKPHTLYDGTPAPVDAYTLFKDAGYTWFGNMEDFKAGYKNASKILLTPEEGKSVSFRLDADHNPQDHIFFKDMVGAAVDFFMKDGCKQGFFIMAEGGKIDSACHSHDAAASVRETVDFDEGIQVALEFYKKHPKQTLIVITADHETGSLTLSAKKPEKLALLGCQTNNVHYISHMLKQELKKYKDSPMPWEEVKSFLTKYFGFWDKIDIKWPEERRLRDCYYETIAKKQAGSVKDLYSDNAKITVEAMHILHERCGIYWVGSHSSCFTPVFAIGVGAENFSRQTDNAQVGRDIIRIAQYK